MKFIKLLLLMMLVFTSTAKAQELSELFKISGEACETISSSEAKSTARVRVADKATFNAVSNLPQLINYKKELNTHDFNVMVYTIVDDYVEDLNVQTSKESADEICVSINGYVNEQNALKAIDGTFEKQASEETIVDKKMEMTADLSAEITAQLNVGKNLQTTNVEEAEDNVIIDGKPQNKTLVFIEPTEFFNGMKSPEHAEIIRQYFTQSDDFLVTDNQELADYKMRTKVLRAKVEAINNNSNRLQMVISVEAISRDGKNDKIVHQNRFVLFDETETDQDAAYKLMKKLFENACQQLIPNMLKNNIKEEGFKQLPPIITPAEPREHRMINEI